MKGEGREKWTESRKKMMRDKTKKIHTEEEGENGKDDEERMQC